MAGAPGASNPQKKQNIILVVWWSCHDEDDDDCFGGQYKRHIDARLDLWYCCLTPLCSWWPARIGWLQARCYKKVRNLYRARTTKLVCSVLGRNIPRSAWKERRGKLAELRNKKILMLLFPPYPCSPKEPFGKVIWEIILSSLFFGETLVERQHYQRCNLTRTCNITAFFSYSLQGVKQAHLFSFWCWRNWDQMKIQNHRKSG